ncbi:ESX secretion-associated protein EspG [Nocardia rosealba]|uniref:ESX secretion-associated protein EspG n=1 Tax=Nocardia rosealba TaxID=2878563 RepID=UPI001CD97A36|nr:ESX secretion-associated protein EspG [Nocardia rosealba]MCA2210132.1 ESX secretion-associated protein EspG [Nocardia rosealba]
MSRPQAPALDHTWVLDPHAFAIGLEAHGRDRMPYPLTFQPEFAETMGIHRQRREAARHRLVQVYDAVLDRVFRAVLEPEVRVEIQGLHGPGQTEVVRVYAGIVEDHVALAVQAPGPTREQGGDITLSVVPLGDLAAAIVAKLPRLHGGSTQRFEGRRSDLETATFARHPTRLSPVEHTQRFFRRPRIGTGEITVFPGFQVDSRPTSDGKAFLWLDYPDDGRYLLQHHDADNFTVIPGPPAELEHRLFRHIAIFTDRR